MIGDSDIAEQENEQDKKALEKYEAQKKVEQDRRLRTIEAQKKQLALTFDAELKDKYGDYDEMLRRKKEKADEQKEEVEFLKNQIEQKRSKLKQKDNQAPDLEKDKEQLIE